VAALALALVGSRDTIAVDAGPTALALARALPDSFRGTVITHSMPVLQALIGDGCGGRVVALGGELRPDRLAFVGPSTETALARLRARTFFLDPAAVDARGIYAASPAEASVQCRLMDIADDVVLLATAEVVADSAPALVAPLDRLARFVTDRTVPPGLATALRRAGVPVHDLSGAAAGEW
jgi:DeoR/GlpR family transcriptional regulator of sugar metabolism